MRGGLHTTKQQHTTQPRGTPVTKNARTTKKAYGTSRTREGAPERETDNGKKHTEPDATHNTDAMQCTCLHDMNECHTLTPQNEESPKDKEPEMEIDEAGDLL